MNLPIDVKANLTKPATILIQKIANATGVVYEPTRIVRKAKAESEAKLIKARTDMEVKRIKKLGELELSDIQKRGVTSFVYQQERKQHNIEQIISLALPLIPEDAPTENIDEDWLAYFFAHCELVSDKDMQSLWANLLAGESSKNSSFSKRTIDFVAIMSKDDAKLFTRFCQFCITLNDEMTPFIFYNFDEIYINNGITLDVLYKLESIGLIKFISEDNVFSKFLVKKVSKLHYFNNIIPDISADIYTGHIIFSQIGVELAPICGAKVNEEFYNSINRIYEKFIAYKKTPRNIIDL